MTTVRRITADDGDLLRSVRLKAIADSPGFYATTLAQAERRPSEQWGRVAEAGSVGTDQGTWFAEVDDEAPGHPPVAAGPETAGPETAGPETAGPETAGPETAGPETAGPVIAGMVNAYRTSDNLVTLTSLWSAPGHRAIGTAALLVEEVQRWAEASGADALRLWVVERNEFARKFYEDLGFEATGEQMTYEPDPRLIECEMRKSL